MSKQEQKTKDELLAEKQKVIIEIEELENMIAVSDTSCFDTIIKDAKAKMKNFIEEEDWKSLKSYQNKIDSFREVTKIIKNQSNILDNKKEELKNIEWCLSHYQMNLFENNDEKYIKYTGLFVNEIELKTGDIFASETNVYYLINETDDEKYVLLSNIRPDKDDLESSLPLLEQLNYMGNAYEDVTELTEEIANQIIEYHIQCDEEAEKDSSNK